MEHRHREDKTAPVANRPAGPARWHRSLPAMAAMIAFIRALGGAVDRMGDAFADLPVGGSLCTGCCAA